MSNDKPRLRFSTIGIHIVKIMVYGNIIPQFLLQKTVNTHNTAKQQFGTRGAFRCPSSLSGNEFLLPLLHSTVVF